MMRQTHSAASRALTPVAAILLSIVMIAAAQTATAALADSPEPSAAQPPVEELEELDEIWVRGKLTANLVVDAENRVFRLYNKLNKNNRYDVYCNYMRLDRDSMIMQRACVPEFLNTFSYASPYRGQSFRPTPRCTGMTSYRDTNGEAYYMASCPADGYDSGFSASSYYGGYGSYGTASYGEPRPAVPRGTPEQRAAYAENVLRVIKGDPKLLEMANGLAAMYQEMDRIQAHYVKVRQEKLAVRQAAREAAKARKRATGRLSPRTTPR